MTHYSDTRIPFFFTSEYVRTKMYLLGEEDPDHDILDYRIQALEFKLSIETLTW